MNESYVANGIMVHNCRSALILVPRSALILVPRSALILVLITIRTYAVETRNR
ncbi:MULTISPECIES: hypothetical protein [Methanosarcina]|uniref:hypothetical protein n=1 Tax=Methanosarcina TaxID=2207 RepID=UPI0009E22543